MRVNENSLLASIVKDSFFEFVVEFWDTIIQEPPVFNWHVKYICDELQTIAERVFKGEPRLYDLVINVPPGSSKSTLVSQMFPAWCWTRKASTRFICVSYSYNIALKDAIRCRDIIQSDKYQSTLPGIELREDENMKGLYVNTQTGQRLSAGMGGAVTGQHGHFLIVDDPLNPEQSYSEAELLSVNRFMETTLPSRKIDKRVAVTILVQQRLHQADPSGEMLSKAEEGSVKHICLPGELLYDKDGVPNCSPASAADFYKDGLLDPIRMPRDVLMTVRKDLGAYGYSSQILQDPVPLGGGMFETAKLVLEDDCLVNLARSARAWDKAGTKDGGNYTVGVNMAVDSKGDFWILDVERGQWGTSAREAMIDSTADRDGSIPILLEIEGGSGGKESGENTVRMLAGHRVHIVHPTGDKEARAYPFASQVGAGTVHVLKRPWTKEYIEELRYFPKSRYSDQVDASSLAFNYLAKRKTKIGAF